MTSGGPGDNGAEIKCPVLRDGLIREEGLKMSSMAARAGSIQGPDPLSSPENHFTTAIASMYFP